MNPNFFRKIAAGFLALAAFPVAASSAASRPNIVIIFTDDQGYNDVGCYGSPKIRTPRLDQMAKEGLRFTDFYVSSSICSASRASLLTGRYPDLHGVGGAIFPGEKGLAASETTLAEILKNAGYRTACYGKWHLGDSQNELPTQRGFDAYFGIPFSNDMYIAPDLEFAENAVFREGRDLASARAEQKFVRSNPRGKLLQSDLADLVPLMRDNAVVEYPADQATLTRRYFDEAVAFIRQSAEAKDPFFVFINPAMPHVPLFASEEFSGKSPRGPYGDVIEEIDAHIGRLLDLLDADGLGKDTLVLFASDNGPWLIKGDAGGSAFPFRDGKHSVYEGGLRVPAIARWSGHIPAGTTSHAVISTVDLLPTFATLAGATLPEVPLDGLDLREHLKNPSTAPERPLFYAKPGGQLAAVRVGDWKYLPHGGGRDVRPKDPPELYNLAEDPGETQNLIEKEPARAAELAAILERFAKRPR